MRDAGENAPVLFLRRQTGSLALGRFCGLLLGLDPVPERLHLHRGEIARIAEDMRMPADQLGGDRLDHVRKGEGAFLLSHAGVEGDLEQQISELVP